VVDGRLLEPTLDHLCLHLLRGIRSRIVVAEDERQQISKEEPGDGDEFGRGSGAEDQQQERREREHDGDPEADCLECGGADTPELADSVECRLVGVRSTEAVPGFGSEAHRGSSLAIFLYCLHIITWE